MPNDPQKPGFHIPWFHKDPEAEQRKADEAKRQQEQRLRAEQVRYAEQQRQRDDLHLLSSGSIPTQAKARLAEIGNTQGDGILFTSDLSPDEAALLRREGFRARGLVTGSAMYHVGQAYASAYNDCEVDVLSNAYDEATSLAVSRLRQELQLIGAHGVVGVRIELVRHEWADKTIEVQVIGTAVEGRGIPPKEPWMCDLSGQEWYALYRAGYEPAALVWGHCAWFVLTTQQDEWIHQSWSNQEMTHWSNALSRARHIAQAKVIRRAKDHHGTGVAGVKITRRLDEVRLYGQNEDPVYEREHHNLVIAIIGTAIRVRPGSSPTAPATQLVISLLDGRLATVGVGAVDAAIE
jgi:uncharacterized protein YbjQ (UPF0145 family)